MDFLNKHAGAIALVAIVIAIGGYYFSGHTLNFGGTTNYDEVDATAIKIGGSSGSRVGPVISTTCTPTGVVSFTASTTKAFDCAVTGVVSGDTVISQVATSTVLGPVGGFYIVASLASTSPGFVTQIWFNGSGSTGSPSTAGFSSSTAVLITHPRTSVPGL